MFYFNKKNIFPSVKPLFPPFLQPAMPEPNLDTLLFFLQTHSHLFHTPNYEFLSKQVYKNINQKWLVYMSTLDHHQLSLLPTKWADFEDCPDSLQHFFSQATALSCFSELVKTKEESISPIPRLKTTKGIKPKKLHEFTHFSHLVQKECAQLGVKRLVDIGSGLGHMLNFLSTDINQRLECVGIETNQQYCCSARKRYKTTAIHCVHFGVDDAQTRAILTGAQDKKTALISLHGCGDLQPMLLQEFVRLQHTNHNIPLLLTVGCCYHKMGDIESWPMSNAVSQALSRLKKPWSPNQSAWRLACQERITKWKSITEQEHESHKQNFMNRAIVECFYKERGIASQSQPRGFNRNLGSSLEELETNILLRNSITCPLQSDQWRVHIRKIHAEYQHIAQFVEPFTALQFALQGMLELLILWDRVLYLKEQGLDAHLKTVFDSQLSPRNMCVVANSKHLPKIG